MTIEFTREFHVPGKVPKRMEDDHRERYNFAAQFVKGKSVLDIACGTGQGSSIIAGAGAARVDGVDISEVVLNYAKSNYQADNLYFHKGDIINYRSNSNYDIIICYETVEHIKNYHEALLNLNSLLRGDGILILSSPNRPITSPSAISLQDRPSNEFHEQEFTIPELQMVLRDCHFVVKESNVYGQRLQIDIANRYLRKIYQRFFKPHIHASPVVKRFTKLVPRYFIIIAAKSKDTNV